MSDSFFLEKDFNAALHESISPDVISWEFFVESHGLNIYRSLKQVSLCNLYHRSLSLCQVSDGQYFVTLFQFLLL